jgi:hypothetical protein
VEIVGPQVLQLLKLMEFVGAINGGKTVGQVKLLV